MSDSTDAGTRAGTADTTTPGRQRRATGPAPAAGPDAVPGRRRRERRAGGGHDSTDAGTRAGTVDTMPAGRPRRSGPRRDRRDVVPPHRRRVGAGLVGGLAAVAAAEWHVVFGWPTTVPLVLAAAVAAGLALAAGSPRRPLAVTGSISLAFLLVVLAVQGRDPAPGAILDGLVHGWSRILSTTLEVPPTEGRILLPAGVAWLAGMIGAEAALRLRSWPAVAVLAPLTAYGVALPFGAGGGSVVSAVVLLAGSLATVRVLSPPTMTGTVAGTVAGKAAGSAPGSAAKPSAAVAPGPDPAGSGTAGSRPAGRRSAGAAGAGGGWAPLLRIVGLAVVVGGAAAAGLLVAENPPLIEGAEPYDPGRDQRPPLRDVQTIDPMSELAGWALDPDDPVLFTARGPATDRWRLAVLDHYDPATGWSNRASYVAAGSRLPPPDVPATAPAGGPSVERTVTIGELDGVWLPTTGVPAATGGLDVHVDRATMMVVHGEGLAPGLRYRLTSEPGQVADDCSEADDPVAPPTGDDPLRTIEIVTYATAITRGSTSQCDQAERIESYLRSDSFAFSAESPSGSTLARTVRLLRVEEGQDDPNTGTSEQFATAFALLARASGLEVRVTVGFRPGTARGDTHEVHASDAYAWAEVRFDDLGWVSFDPTPGTGDDDAESESPIPPVPPAPTTTSAPATTAPSTTAPATTTTTAVEGSCGDGGRCAEGGAGQAVAVIAGVGLAALAAGMVLATAVARRQRRAARRRRSTAADQVIGAWRQCLVELRDGGLPLAPANTVSDYVAEVESRLGARFAYELDTVATLANRALFKGEASDEDAALAWRATERLTSALASDRSAAGRVRRAFDVRALARS